MEMKMVKDLKKGEYFTLNDHGEYPDEKNVYVRGDYDRSDRKYEIHKFSDYWNTRFIKGTKKVYVGFTF